MAELDRCSTCGCEFSTPGSGRCLRCQTPLASGDPQHHAFRASEATILTIIEADAGPVQSIVLRETGDEFEPPLSKSGEPAVTDTTIRYSIDGEIACGGMGSVLKGRDPDIGRPVAIKVLRSDLHNKPDMVRRFVEEVQIGGQLQHPGIVPIYEMGTFADRRPFFSMKLVKGHTLANLLQTRHDPTTEFPRFLGIFEQIAQTMAYVHSRGVIHRDLKPSNVMVGAFGEVQVMDWGLAKVLPGGATSDDLPPAGSVMHTVRSDSEEGASVAGTVLGTPSYMAPEQARGQIEAIDERTDVFGMGSILCEILTGKPAIVGQSHREILMLTARGDITDAVNRLKTSSADPKLIALALQCLEPDPQRRPNHAGEVNSAITAYLTGVQERVRSAELERVKAEARALEEQKRRRVTMALAASIMATMLIGGGAWVWTTRQYQARVATNSRMVEEALVEANSSTALARKTKGDVSSWETAHEKALIAKRILGTEVESHLPERVSGLLKEVEVGLIEAKQQAERFERNNLLKRKFDEVRAQNADKKSDDYGDIRHEGYSKVFMEEGFDFYAQPNDNDGNTFRSSEIAEDIAAALDDWAVGRMLNRNGYPQRLLKMAQTIDPDPWRNRLRDALSRNDNTELIELAKGDTSTQPTRSLVLLGESLVAFNEAESAIRILKQAQRRDPGDFLINYALGSVYAKSNTDKRKTTEYQTEAIRYLSNAIAIKKNSGLAHNKLAFVLRDANKREESLAEFREAIKIWPDFLFTQQAVYSSEHIQQELTKATSSILDAIAVAPKNAELYFDLGDLYFDKFSYEDAIKSFRQATELEPDMALAHTHMARSLTRIGSFDDALREHRLGVGLGVGLESIKATETHEYYGVTLRILGRLHEAINHLREAIRLNFRNASAHHYLGNSLADLGFVDEAILEYELSVFMVKSWKRDGARHDHVSTLISVGEFDQAEKVVKAAVEEVGSRPIGKHLQGTMLLAKGDPKNALDLFEQVEKQLLEELLEGYRAIESLREEIKLGIRLEKLAPHLDEIRNGMEPDLNADDQIHLADLAMRRQLYSVAVRLFREAFRHDPNLVNDSRSAWRFRAALAAVLASVAPVGDSTEISKSSQELLKQALDWYRDELESQKARVISNGVPEKSDTLALRNQLTKDLRILIRHRDLAVVRDTSRLSKMDDGLREEWKSLWIEIHSLLASLTSNESTDQSAETLTLAREAVLQFPTSKSARHGLAVHLIRNGALNEGISLVREASRIAAIGPEIFSSVAESLRQSQRPKESSQVLLEALRQGADRSKNFDRLEFDFYQLDDLKDCIEIAEQLILIAPDDPNSHLLLANAILKQWDELRFLSFDGDLLRTSFRVLHVGDIQHSLASLREAVRLDPDPAGAAAWSLGRTLRELGMYDEALIVFRKIRDNVRAMPEALKTVDDELAKTERFREFEARLNRIPNDEFKLAASDKLKDFADACRRNGRFSISTKAWKAMLTSDPTLSEDPKAANRYLAAHFSILAGSGKESDVSIEQQAKFRQYGFAWLTAELAHSVKLLEQGKSNSRIRSIANLQRWKRDPDLAMIRDTELLKTLPDDEQIRWKGFWKDVDALLQQARNDGWSGEFLPVIDAQHDQRIPDAVYVLINNQNQSSNSGRRLWKRSSPEIFVGKDENNIEFEARMVGRTTISETTGTVYERIGNENLQYLIPDRSERRFSVMSRSLDTSEVWKKFAETQTVLAIP